MLQPSVGVGGGADVAKLTVTAAVPVGAGRILLSPDPGFRLRDLVPGLLHLLVTFPGPADDIRFQKVQPCSPYKPILELDTAQTISLSDVFAIIDKPLHS